MGRRIKKLKKIRIHREGTDTLVYSAMALIAIGIILWRSFESPIPFYLFAVVFGITWGVVLNFFRCKVKLVEHHNGHFHKAWLPKASDENEMTDIIITTDDGVDILCRQVAGAMARRIVTYAKEGDDCYIDEHLGFIKFGSRVDLFLPVDTKICVEMRQSTTGNQTIIGMLKKHDEI